ncbi:hypothetical protein A5320_06025 [Rheinheimera sp. SA_1]|uniref:hypothetical protein n=1 Tax=Rheinheimera sp. SA_1 TaxID=1827365 RepID=UPI0008005565|nr:hypothetical protein [Rheinheimera sp. SA_1]OBP16908.1 hypothetical protein A5320_06025 [Rheinheimera sp. SA_1]
MSTLLQTRGKNRLKQELKIAFGLIPFATLLAGAAAGALLTSLGAAPTGALSFKLTAVAVVFLAGLAGMLWFYLKKLDQL